MANRVTNESRDSWVKWLTQYGLKKFAKSLIRNVQGCQSTCVHCNQTIYLDFFEGGGVGDWGIDGDYGCPQSPDTNDEGTGGHHPKRWRE